MKKTKSVCRRLPEFGLCAAAVIVMTACADEATQVEYGTMTEVTPLEWETFKEQSSLYSEDGTRTFVIEGDIGVNEQVLRKYYEDHFLAYTDKSSVETSGGADIVWSATDKLNITYCVGDSFGAQKPRALINMKEAAAQWMSAANVVLTYVPSQDAACSSANTGVKLNVLPQSTGGGNGCFPNLCRTLLFNYNAYFEGYSWVGAWTHEVGHTLGLGHEHINPPCNFADGGTVRLINSYDINSAMHYSVQCGSSSTGQMTPTDKDGLATLYGSPASSSVAVLPGEWIRTAVNNLVM